MSRCWLFYPWQLVNTLRIGQVLTLDPSLPGMTPLRWPLSGTSCFLNSIYPTIWSDSVALTGSILVDDPVDIGGHLYALGPLLGARCVQRMVLVHGKHHFLIPSTWYMVNTLPHPQYMVHGKHHFLIPSTWYMVNTPSSVLLIITLPSVEQKGSKQRRRHGNCEVSFFWSHQTWDSWQAYGCLLSSPLHLPTVWTPVQGRVLQRHRVSFQINE